MSVETRSRHRPSSSSRWYDNQSNKIFEFGFPLLASIKKKDAGFVSGSKAETKFLASSQVILVYATFVNFFINCIALSAHIIRNVPCSLSPVPHPILSNTSNSILFFIGGVAIMMMIKCADVSFRFVSFPDAEGLSYELRGLPCLTSPSIMHAGYDIRKCAGFFFWIFFGP